MHINQPSVQASYRNVTPGSSSTMRLISSSRCNIYYDPTHVQTKCSVLAYHTKLALASSQNAVTTFSNLQPFCRNNPLTSSWNLIIRVCGRGTSPSSDRSTWASPWGELRFKSEKLECERQRTDIVDNLARPKHV